jgi:hypothetical protein
MAGPGGSNVVEANGLGATAVLGLVLGAGVLGLAKALGAAGREVTAEFGEGLGAKGLGGAAGPGVSEASGVVELLALFADNRDGGGAVLRGGAGLAVITA